MKVKYIQLLSALGFMLLIGCNTPSARKNIPTVTVSIGPQKYFVERLLDSLVDVNVMIPPGASHATYSPTPGQLVKLSHSDAYFLIGHLSFEATWKEKLMTANKNMKWFDLSKGIQTIHGDHHHHDHNHTCSHGADPHTWTSPRETMQILSNLQSYLIELYPEYADTIKTNYNNFAKEIEQLDNRLTTLQQLQPGLAFMIFHPAYTYLAKNYGFEQLTIEFEGKTPTPARLQATIQQAKEKSISTIYVQQEFDRSNAETIANAINAKTVQVNPLSENWLEEMERFITYLENK